LLAKRNNWKANGKNKVKINGHSEGKNKSNGQGNQFKFYL
jgi:hypothetical protein